jgi:hypothetical protein
MVLYILNFIQVNITERQEPERGQKKKGRIRRWQMRRKERRCNGI